MKAISQKPREEIVFPRTSIKKNWQHCKLATVRMFKISLIDYPIDAFEGGLTVFYYFNLKKNLSDGGRVTLNFMIIMICMKLP